VRPPPSRRRRIVPLSLHIAFAIAATLLSAGFFVGGKVLIARHGMAWPALWRWTLVTTGVLGTIGWLAQGAPMLPWGWCLAAGAAGALAHICANQALAWGDASVLVPVSGAKPLVMIPLLWLVFGQVLPPNLVWACALATLGIALGGLGPVRRHVNAPHPRWGFALMLLSVVLMTFSDLFGAKVLVVAGADMRWPAIAGWCMGLGSIPLLSAVVVAGPRPLGALLARSIPLPVWLLPGKPEAAANRGRAALQGVLFTAFIVTISLAFALAPDPALAVAEVNIVVACRGVIAVLMVLALDRWMGTGLEPLPWWIHLLRLAGAAVLASAVALALR
jgi:drug/metabolite transporter (DMT)-like permease